MDTTYGTRSLEVLRKTYMEIDGVVFFAARVPLRDNAQ